MKHLSSKRNRAPSGLRRLLRPGPRPWFRRPVATDAAPAQHGSEGEPTGGPTPAPGAVLDFERLVARYVRLSELRDRALAETRVGEDALSVGDALKASQHFAASEHYQGRARELETAIEHEVERRALGDARELERAGEALRTARRRVYGSPEAHTRPEFA